VVGWNSLLKDYQKNRIISFLNPSQHKTSTGYQIIQSKIAIGSGGLSGKGYLKGSQSQYQFLPARHTDFIVSVIGEEFGFINIAILFFIFFVIFYRQFRFNFQSDEEFYFIYLFNGLILFQFLINVAMAIGFFPVLGISLPFVSYGGSSLLSFFIGEAIVFRIKINNYLT
jgi:rod shape determining protein RodA